LVAGLLRSHARVLSALYQQGMPAGGQARIPQPVPISKRPLPVATDIVGVTPNDETVSISLGNGVDTLLAFLSGGCSVCGELWAGAPAGEEALPDRTRLVVVTASPDRESPSRVRRLAEPGVTVVMSTDAWQDYRVPAAPYFVLVEGTGRIAGEGSAQSWRQVASLMGTASGDPEAARGAGRCCPRRPRPARPGPPPARRPRRGAGSDRGPLGAGDCHLRPCRGGGRHRQAPPVAGAPPGRRRVAGALPRLGLRGRVRVPARPRGRDDRDHGRRPGGLAAGVADRVAGAGRRGRAGLRPHPGR